MQASAVHVTHIARIPVGLDMQSLAFGGKNGGQKTVKGELKPGACNEHILKNIIIMASV